MLSVKELLDMQEVSVLSQPSTCTIRRPGFAADQYGGQVETETIVAQTTCRLAPAGQSRGNQATIAENIATKAEWTIAVPLGTDVQDRDIVTVDGLGEFLVEQAVRRSIATAVILYCSTEVD